MGPGTMVSIARAGLPWIAMPVAGLILSIAAFIYLDRWWTFIPVVGLAALSGFFTFFFRDPDRMAGDGILCPADGKVSRIWKDGDHVVVAIFMNVHNVHVNRVPLDGKVTSVEHIDGGYLPAYRKDSDRNERFITTMNTRLGKVKVVQIAGVLVRRIRPYIRKDQLLVCNQKLGIVCFGSRVDTYLPVDKVELKVKVGDRTLAGVTTLATERSMSPG